MQRRLDDLDGGIIADLRRVGRGQRNLRQAKSALPFLTGRPSDLENGYHVQRHVDGQGANAQVDVHEGRRMAREPARLHGHGATANRPLGTVLRQRHATT